jgi:hypothetical protein
VATPEAFEKLDDELTAALDENAETLGTQLAKIQEEITKGKEVATKRIENLKAQRKKEEEKAKRPRELLKELNDLGDALQAKTAALKEASTAEITSDSRKDVQKLVDELTEEVQSFTKALLAFNSKNAQEIKTASSSIPSLQKEYKEASDGVTNRRKEADAAVLQAKQKIAASVKKEKQDRIEAAKPELQAQIDEVADLLAAAEKDILSAESVVYPFSRGKQKQDSEEKILATCAEAETAISVAESTTQTALDKKPSLAEDIDEAVKADLEAFMKASCKKSTIRLKQFQARIGRCKQLVKTAKKDIEKDKRDALIKELKPKLLEEITDMMDVDHLTEPMKDLETQCVPFGPLKVPKKDELEESMGLLEEAEQAVESFKETVEQARAALAPIDESLDEEVQKELKKYLAGEAKAPLAKLTAIDARIKKVELYLTNFKAKGRRIKVAEQVAELKDALLEKATAAGSDAVKELEQSVATAEEKVAPFARGCKAPPSEYDALTSAAEVAIDQAKVVMSAANTEVCPIDESLEQDVKKELLAIINPAIKKPKLRVGQLERRIRRCSQLIKYFREDLQKHEERAAAAKKKKEEEEAAAKLKQEKQKIEKAKTKAIAVVRAVKAKGELSSEDLVAKFEPEDDLVDEAAFQKFFKDAGFDDGISEEDAALVFKAWLPEGEEKIPTESLRRFCTAYMKVVKPTPLTDGVSISSSKAKKQLKLGQVVEVLEGPKADGESSIMRARVKTVAGDAEGWATVKGNAGTEFLKTCAAPAVKDKPAEKKNGETPVAAS